MCTENWVYSSWSTCSSNLQTRTASDYNNCGTTIERDELSQSCTSSSSSGGGGGGSSSSESVEEDNLLVDTNSNYDVYVDGRRVSRDKLVEDKQEVVLEINTNKVSFEHDFDDELDLSDTEIVSDFDDKINYLIVKNLDLGFGESKTITLKKNFNTNFVCIIDKEISSKNSFSNDCSNNDEIKLICDNKYDGKYKCKDSTTDFIIYGLKHSAVYEYKVAEDTSEETLPQEEENIPSNNNDDHKITLIDNTEIKEGQDILEVSSETENNEIKEVKNISVKTVNEEDESNWFGFIIKSVGIISLIGLVLYILK
jgi:hypothetical protein